MRDVKQFFKRNVQANKKLNNILSELSLEIKEEPQYFFLLLFSFDTNFLLGLQNKYGLEKLHIFCIKKINKKNYFGRDVARFFKNK